MADKHILHMLSPLKHVSPFDVNMALDAGFDAVVPYEDVQLDDVTGLVQDAIFSRPPRVGVRTGVFIGGRDALVALDMMEAAKKAMVPPFAVSLFADPYGSFTTAAAMVARVERVLQGPQCQRELRGLRLAMFGATGVVGFASGVIAALEGMAVTLVGYDGPDRVAEQAEEIRSRFGWQVRSADGSTDAQKKSDPREHGRGVLRRQGRGAGPLRRAGARLLPDRRRRRERRAAARVRGPGRHADGRSWATARRSGSARSPSARPSTTPRSACSSA